MIRFRHVQQLGLKDCGPACLKMIALWHGRNYDMNYLRQKCNITKMGVSMLGISEAAQAIGFNASGYKLDEAGLKKALTTGPVIAHWKNNHFVVLYKIRRGRYYVADPAQRMMEYSKVQFMEGWRGEQPQGHVLMLQPDDSFFLPQREGLAQEADFSILWPYLRRYRHYFGQLLIGMIMGSSIALLGPILTQLLVDSGIEQQDIGFVYLILAAQLALFIGSTLINIIRSWILMHIGTRINIAMVSDFFKKVMHLPMAFYEQYVIGDLMQRMADYNRIEKLLTVDTLGTIFSLVNVVVLGIVLYVYHVPIFFLFFGGSLLSLLWVYIFLRRRRNIDYLFFEQHTNSNNKTLEIFGAMQDIKISNGMAQKRSEWEKVQHALYAVTIKSLTLSQVQGTGSSFLSRLVNLLVTFIAAKAVIEEEITLGTMFAISMIVGQISQPIARLLSFVTTYQDAKIGLERVHDITAKEDEDPSHKHRLTSFDKTAPIRISGLTFHYGSESLSPVLKDLNLDLPAGKVTAIVGASGSGKTTLIKLLLKFYEPNSGGIFVGRHDLRDLHHGSWRETCGVVLQDGQLLSGTIAENITLGREREDKRMIEAASMANIHTFIVTLPQGYETDIGMEGLQVSAGQKQRLLLARAIYKDPMYLFLDEATSALDADNEKLIIHNLQQFFRNRTAVVVAHRLSTVQSADNIIVLEHGKIVKSGSHNALVELRGNYYHLVKNQLELGS